MFLHLHIKSIKLNLTKKLSMKSIWLESAEFPYQLTRVLQCNVIAKTTFNTVFQWNLNQYAQQSLLRFNRMRIGIKIRHALIAFNYWTPKEILCLGRFLLGISSTCLCFRTGIHATRFAWMDRKLPFGSFNPQRHHQFDKVVYSNSRILMTWVQIHVHLGNSIGRTPYVSWDAHVES